MVITRIIDTSRELNMTMRMPKLNFQPPHISLGENVSAASTLDSTDDTEMAVKNNMDVGGLAVHDSASGEGKEHTLIVERELQDGGERPVGDNENRPESVDGAPPAESSQTDNNLLTEEWKCAPVPFNSTSVVMYTRVPKTAGSTVQAMIRKIGAANAFPYRPSTEYTKWYLDPEDRGKFAASLMARRGAVYDRHLYYLRHSDLGYMEPLYIGLVRDPLARTVSNFYYAVQRGFITSEKTYDECIGAVGRGRRAMSYCRTAPDTQLRFFCGHDPICAQGGRPALELAKRHLRERYVTVGYTEDLKAWLAVLARLLPHWFRKAPTLTRKVKNARVASSYESPSEEVTALVRDYMRDDIEFYEYARALFDAQLQACKKSS